MSPPLRWIALAVAAGSLALPALAQGAAPMDLTVTRVLADGTQTLKGDDGTPVTLRATLTYEPGAGQYVRTVADASGAIVAQETFDNYMVQPTDVEENAAQALIAADAELAALIDQAADPVVVSGGFPLVREAGHPCGPGSRCVQYDIFQVPTGSRHAERIRFVVIDLRTVSFVSRDFDAATEGNFANPAIRDESRSR